jgi:hypothetical protein
MLQRTALQVNNNVVKLVLTDGSRRRSINLLQKWAINLANVGLPVKAPATYDHVPINHNETIVWCRFTLLFIDRFTKHDMGCFSRGKGSPLILIVQARHPIAVLMFYPD